MITYNNMPAHVRATVDALRSAGWVDANECGRSAADLVTLIDRGEVEPLRFGRWTANEIPRVVTMVRLAEVEAAGPVVHLHAVP